MEALRIQEDGCPACGERLRVDAERCHSCGEPLGVCPSLGCINEADAFHYGTAMPFLLRVLICFFWLDALERSWELFDLLFWAPALKSFVVTDFGPNVYCAALWIGVHLLLGVLLWLRIGWGRWWSLAILVIHLLFLARVIAVRNPELWVYLSDAGRARLVFSLLFDLSAVIYLCSSQAADYLDG